MTRAMLYSQLARLFGWTPTQVGEMTTGQIAAVLDQSANESIDPKTGARTREFATVAELRAFQRQIGV